MNRGKRNALIGRMIGLLMAIVMSVSACNFGDVNPETNPSESSEVESVGKTTESEMEESSQEPEIPPVISGTDFGVANPSGVLTETGNKDAMYEPSVEYDPESKQWYVWGSYEHVDKSSDLIVWEEALYAPGLFPTRINELFEPARAWALRGKDKDESFVECLESPDVIYNQELGKWCLYMSVIGDNHYSSIALATADSMSGPYTYQGVVVYSGCNSPIPAMIV